MIDSTVGLTRRAANILLVVCLLTSSTPAAPATLVALTKEASRGFAFWYQSSGLAKIVSGQSVTAVRQETQDDRAAKVSRIQIFPNNPTIELGEHIRFVVVTYDRNGNAVGGVKARWNGRGATANQRARISPNGEFQGIAPGVFTISAQAGGKSAQTSVTVRPGVKLDLKAAPIGTREISTRDLPTIKITSSKKSEKGTTAEKGTTESERVGADKDVRRAHATRVVPANVPEPMPQSGGGGWDDTNYWSADDPDNRVGDPPGATMDGGAGSANFQFTAPVLGLPGRGIGISLGLAYNSRLWNKANTQIAFDNDKGWPSPGFSLGFGKLLGIGVYTGCMLVDADGTRHSYTGSITLYNWGTYGVMHTTDGSFIDYFYYTGTNGVITWAQAKLANGTLINYGAYSQSGGGVFPTSIEDANGNLIYITYLNNAGPRIQTVSDTLGRVINFYYDYNNLLTAITGPGLNGGTRTLARLRYHQIALSYSFSGLSPSVPNSYPWVLDAIYYPATNTGYWLNDSDSYSSYGMLAKVVEQRNMTFSASSLNDMGTVGQGSMTRKEVYNYPLYVGDSSGTQSSNLTDAPTYTTLTDTWTRDGTATDSAVTGYEVHQNDTPRMTIITQPNGTKSKQLSYNAAGQWNDGLAYHDETYVTDGVALQSSDSTWEPGAYGSPRPTRVEKRDERNQMTATNFAYGSVHNQVIEADDYGYNGELLRSTRTTYQNSSNYTGTCYSSGCVGRHIFNLPLSMEVYGSDNSTRVSRTEYQYDGDSLAAAPNVVMHDQANNPHAEEEGYCYYEPDWNDPDCTGECYDYYCDGYCNEIYVCPYDASTTYRGNVTQVTRYADAISLTGAVTDTRHYDVTGNRVTESPSCCEQIAFSYTIDTQYAYPQSKTRGSATDQYAQVTTSATYDFNTGVVRSSRDANGRLTNTDYDENTLRPTIVTLPTTSHTNYSYNDNLMTVTTTSYLAASDGGGIADQNVKVLNGRGQVRQEQALGVSNVWDYVDTTYGSMGQIVQQTRPYRSGDTQQWTSFTYDSLGRSQSVTAPDGSVTQSFYNETGRPDVATSSPGETMRIQDAWGRERWGRTDAFGHLVEVVEPVFWGNGSASVGMQTLYSYNTLGNLITINSMSGAQVVQARAFRYDSLGRLTAQKLAETSATLNDSGGYVGSGTWSDVFTYDDRSNLTSKTDARGVKTIYSYGGDPLNRLQSVSWDTSGFGDTTNPILPAATVTYQYRNRATSTSCDPLDSSGQKDVTQVAGVSTAGVSTTSVCYDTEGRVSSKTLTLNSRSSYPFATDYTYDSLDRVYNVTYPKEYGNGEQPRKLVHHDYDVASRLTSLTFDGQTQVSNIAYNAASQTTSLSVGTGTNQVNENYSYNAQTGLLDQQTATRNGTTLLNLSYDYAGANGKRTGQLTRITNNLDSGKNRGYEYDALGRLLRATGGQNVNWVQRYEYDRFGNRNNVYSFVLEDYIKNFYQGSLNRQPNSSELNSWLSTLQSAYGQGQTQFLTAMQSLGDSLFTSQEYANRNRSNHDYVHDLYNAYLYREPDASGWSWWESTLNTNTRADVRAGFAWSVEFYTKVSGISPHPAAGGITLDGLQGIAYDQSSNRVLNSGWGYDAAGNQTQVWHSGGAVQKFQYDAANRLVVVRDVNNNPLATYTYGDSNERLITEESGLRTYSLREAGVTVAEFTEPVNSSTPAWSKSYVYLGERLLSTLTPNGGGEAVEYDHPDRLGTRITTNPTTGAWSEQVALPFGTALGAESSGTPTNRRFTSYERSYTSGLDYAVNRQYDPEQGRFTQVDPSDMKSIDLSSPQTLNLYAYCTNDPINHTDPSGLGFFSFLRRIIGYIVLALIVMLVVAVVILAVTTVFPALGAYFIAHPFVFGLVVGLLGIVSQHFVLTVYNGIADEIREHGFSLGSIFRGFAKGLGRFFKSLISPIPLLGLDNYGNYCGPGNPNQSSGREPIDELDAACREHDRVYQDPNADSNDIGRADLRLALAAARALLHGRLSRTGNLFALFVTVGFFFKGIFTLLFGSHHKSESQAKTISVSGNGGSTVRFTQPASQHYQLTMPAFAGAMNPAPQRIDRFGS